MKFSYKHPSTNESCTDIITIVKRGTNLIAGRGDVRRFLLNWLWLGIFAIGMGIFLIVHPKYGDDYWYSYDIGDWFRNQGIEYFNGGGNVFKYGIPIHPMASTLFYHWDVDNVRMANMAGTFMLVFPKWLGSTFSWLALLFSVWSCLKLTSVDIRRSWLTVLCISLWTLTFVWHEQMGSLIFQYNYLLPGALCLGVILAVKYKPRGRIAMAGFVFLCIITAMWHEGFTAPMFVSFLALIVCFKEWRNRWVILACFIMLAGLIWHFGGEDGRTKVVAEDIIWDGERAITTVYYHRAVWIALAVSVIYWWRKGFGKFFRSPLIVFMVVSIVMSMGEGYYSNNIRAAWWADIASVVLTLYLLRRMDGRSRGFEGWRGWLSGVLLVMSYAEIAVADVYTIRFAREYPVIIRNFMKDPDKTQFSELADYPWLELPFRQILTDSYRRSQYLANVYLKENRYSEFMKVVPARLRNVDYRDLQPLEGNLNISKYGRYLVAPSDSVNQFWIYPVDIDYGWFTVHDRGINCVPFISEKDGRRYLYIMPANNPTEYEIGDIKGVWANPQSLNNPLK